MNNLTIEGIRLAVSIPRLVIFIAIFYFLIQAIDSNGTLLWTLFYLFVIMAIVDAIVTVATTKEHTENTVRKIVRESNIAGPWSRWP